MHNEVLSVENATLVQGGRTILDGLNLRLQAGDFALLLGSNGAGKSSLIRAIMGEAGLAAGMIRRGRFALISQDPLQSTYGDLTIRENCLLSTTRDCREHLEQLMPRLVELYNSPVRLLSGGERQVLALALCLIDPPELLLLDEHTSALDPVTAERVMEVTVAAVEGRRMATLMTTHNLQHVGRYGNRVLALNSGKLVVDAEAVAPAELVRRCYGASH